MQIDRHDKAAGKLFFFGTLHAHPGNGPTLRES